MKIRKKYTLAFAISMICINMAYAQSAKEAKEKASKSVKDSPFAYLPLSMQAETVTTTNSSGQKYPPPNVMLFIDDSGSMKDIVVTKDETVPNSCAAGYVFREDNGYRYCVSQEFDRDLRQNCYGGTVPFGLIREAVVDNKGRLVYDSAGRLVRKEWRAPFCYKPRVYSSTAKKYVYPLLYRQEGRQNYYYFDEITNAPSRLQVVQEALAGQNGVLDTYKDQFSWSLKTLWGTENNAREIDHPFTTDYQRIKRLVESTRPYAATPATDRYLKAANNVINNMEYACQSNYIIMLSDGDPNGEQNNTYINRQFANLKNRPTSSYRYQNSGLEQGIAFFSQQLNQQDLKVGGVDKEGNSWDDPDFAKQTIKTYTIGFGDSLSENGRKYLADAASPRGEQKIESTGNIAEDSRNSFFYNASDKTAVVAAFADAIKNIAETQKAAAFEGEASFSFSAPAVVNSEDKSFPSLGALMTLDLKHWSSVLKFAALDKDGQTELDAKGNPQYVSADYGSRQIVVNDGKRTYLMAAADNSDAATFGFNGFDDFVEFKQWYMRDASKTDAEIEQAAQAKTKRRVQNYRVRTQKADAPERMMGDVMGTPLLAVGKKDDQAKQTRYMVTAANDGMAYFFEKTDNKKHPYRLIANYLPAAMQRESSDDTDTVGKALAATAEVGYGKTIRYYEKETDPQPHLFLNNGGMQWRTTAKDKNGHQATYLAGAMGQGGRGAYVLAIAGKDRDTGRAIGLAAGGDLARNLPLWETAKGNTNSLGYTYSTPQFAQVATQEASGKADTQSGVRQLLFLANGYYSQDLSKTTPFPYDVQPTLYVYDALGQEMSTGGSNVTVAQKSLGQLVAKIAVYDGQGGLSTPLLVDTDDDALADTAYAGDRGGNVYRFTLKGAPNNWSVQKIYQGNSTQPIIASPAVYHDKPNKRFVVLVGTGSDIYQEDKENTDLQVMLGIFDDPSKPVSLPLQQRDLTKRSFVKENRVTHNQEELNTRELGKEREINDKGWYIEMKHQTEEGERVVTKAQIINKTAFFTSRIYKTIVSTTEQKAVNRKSSPYTCKPKSSSTVTKSEATSWLYSIDVLNGGNPDQGSAFLDVLVSDSSSPQGLGSTNNPASTNPASSETATKKVVAGLQLQGLSSAVSLTSLTAEILAVDPNGGFGNGEDRQAGEQEKRDNTCVQKSDYIASVVDDSGLRNIKVTAAECSTGSRLIRVSTRRIYQ